MKTFRKLHRRASEETPRAHFRTILSTIRRILGEPATPVAASIFSSQDDFARAYLSQNLTAKAVCKSLMSEKERQELHNLTVEDMISIAGPNFDEQLSLLIGHSNLDVGTLRELLRSHREPGGLIDETEARARAAFRTREETNRIINRTETWGYDSTTGLHASDRVGDQVLYRAREIIADILGPCSPAEVAGMASFGNGASASLKRPDAQREKKYLARLTATSGLLEAGRMLVSSSPVWSHVQSPKGDILYIDSHGNNLIPAYTLERAQGAVMDFVVKNAKTKRTIMKEPELNGFIQKGLGLKFRKCLRRYRYNRKVLLDGINLNTSGSLNSELAQLGSEHGYIGTVDGREASDSITVALAEFLLPEDWFNLIMRLRSDFAITPWGRHRLEMVGGMGNGFTFELESIIFYAIGVAAAERSKYPFAEYMVSIHGDDLIIPSDVYNEVNAAYARAGVVVNEDKTFVNGPFRESCGGHFFNGHSVKPFYVKDTDGSNRGDWFWLANSLLLWLADRTEDFVLSHRGKDLSEVLLHLRSYASSGEPRKWTIGTEHARRSGLFGLSFYKLRRGFPLARVVTEVKDSEILPDEGLYLAWLSNPTRVLSVIDLCRHKSASDSNLYETVTKGRERERWKRLTTFTPIAHPSIVAPLWQLCRDHNLQDF